MNLFNILCPKPLKNAFQDDDIRLVGGCVRDSILSMPVQDVDLVVNITPENIITKLKKNNIPYLTTGLKFGTITAIINNTHFEITSLREEISYNGRHPKIVYTNSFKKDALRRDFTFNAIYIDKNGDLFDPFSGKNDLKQGIVRFIGDADERIKEDPLRILRLYRFFGKIGKTICKKSRESTQKNINLIHAISKERIWQEIEKILKLERKLEVLFLLKEDAFFKKETISNNLKHLENPNPITIFTSLNSDLKFNWSTKDLQLHNNLIKFQDNMEDILYLSLFHHKDFLNELVILRFLNKTYNQDEFEKQKNRLQSYIPPLFPLKGWDLITQGIQKGPEIGKILKAEKEKWAKSIIIPDS